ncbi:MAG: lipopolysaccharide biosynthesis protein [Tannerella sp.]|jgi:O-antigen/teichoic acid export membrane protein|nr:lipopolysaccharide biosynthesis protein [Tannerella sp.]
MTEVSLKEKTAKGLFWGGIGTFLQQIIGLIFGILIARILSPDDYGLVAMLAIFTAIANTIMDSGFSNALINRKIIKHEDYNAVFWFSLFSGLLIYIILFFSAPLIAEFYKQPVLVDLSRLLFLSFLFSSLGIAHNAFLLKNIMAKQRGIIDFCSVLCSGIIGLILALNGYVFWGLAVQAITQSFVSTVLRWYFSSWRPTFRIDFSPLKEMLGFSSKVFITSIIVQLTGNILSIVFGRYYGAVQTGYYAQGNKWVSLGSTVMNGMLLNVAQPVLVQANDDRERLVNIFRKMIRFGAFISFPCLLGLAFVGKEFILITVGEKWIDSLFFLQSFCVWGSFSFIWLLYTNMLLSLHKSNIYMWSVLFLSILQIGIVVCMISASIKIMTVVYILGNFEGILFSHYYINKLIGLRLRDVIKDLFPYLFSTLISIFVGWLVVITIDYNNYLNLLIKIVVVALIYIVIMKKSKSIIFKESIGFLKRILGKNK